MQKKYKTAIYARLSRDDGDTSESNSITSQKALCEDYIAKHSDLELVETFTDDGFSGVSFERPGFERLEQAVRSGRIECIVCKDLSRFSRNYIDAGRYLERVFPSLGIRFIAVNDSYDTLTANPQMDSFILPFKNLINDSYCKDISVKIRSSLEIKRKNGEYVGNFEPYGYMKAPENSNVLVVDEYAAGVVSSIFAMFKDGKSPGLIAEVLNERGVLSPMEYKLSRGIKCRTPFKKGERAKWTYNAVKRVLTDEVYTGVLLQGKSSTPNYKDHRLKPRERMEWVRAANAVPALITPEDYYDVTSLLKRDMRSLADKEAVNVFSGFLYCADCGQPMVRTSVPAKNKTYLYYVCSGAKGKNGCRPHRIRVEEVENTVLHAVVEQINKVLDLERSVQMIKDDPGAEKRRFGYEAQIEKLREEIERCQNMKLRLYEDLTDGMISREEYREYRERYTAGIEDKNRAISSIEEEMDKSLAAEEQKWMERFVENRNIKSLSRRVLMSLVDKIFVYENHAVEIRFRYGDEFDRAKEFVESQEGC
ncbi:MAG: recombinase family protein [Lachnospiraceae bacterium]|nr:recombinase family protein [Lachnospiraceae bacterium]